MPELSAGACALFGVVFKGSPEYLGLSLVSGVAKSDGVERKRIDKLFRLGVSKIRLW